MSTISAGTTNSTALVETGDTTGNLIIKANTSTTVGTFSSTGLAVVGSLTSTTPAAGAFTTLSATATNAGITINTAATTNFGQLSFNTTNPVLFQAFDSAYATSGSAMANSLRIYSTGANGVNVVDTAGGGLNYYDGSTTKAVGISPSGLKMFAGYNIGVGAATPTTSGAGITFPATQSASTDANTLDDYEEGSWTPGQGSGLTVVGTFSSAGRYVKIGRVVTITGHVKATTSVAFLAANAIIANNLPFSSNDGGGLLPSNGVGVNDAANANAVFAVSSTNMYSQGAMAATPAYYFSVTYFYSI